MVRDYPQYLSSPLQVLWFEIDTLVIILLGFLLGNVMGGWWWISLFVLPAIFEALKKNQARGFLKHSLYYLGIIEFKNYPSYFDNEFSE